MAEMTLEVVKVEALTPQIRSLTLRSADGSALPAFAAGAHIRVALPDGGDRTYSLVNSDPAPGATDAPDTYRLGVRLEEESRGGSRYMHSLKEGDTIRAFGPKNDFALADGQAHSVLIAGGIGVTPIISMMAELKSRGRPFRFVYSGRSRPLMAFTEEIERVSEGALTVHCDDEAGCVLDLNGLIAGIEQGAHIYVCGPRTMIEAARETAVAAGFPKDHIHFELFDAPAQAGADGSFEVEVKSTGEVFTIPPGKTIIEVLEAGGVDLVYDCQRGDCGICQTGVIEGVPDHRDVILTDDERAANNIMQICVSRAKSPRLVLDL